MAVLVLRPYRLYCYWRYTVRYTGIMAIISLPFYLNRRKVHKQKTNNVCVRKIGYRLDFNILEQR